MGNLFQSVDLLQQGVDVTWLRNQVISNNIANADTVGFKASEVQFEDIFKSALNEGGSGSLATTHADHISGQADLATTHQRHIDLGNGEGVQPVVATDNATSLRMDENNVDIEHEMTELAKNSVEYYALVSKVNAEFNKLNTAINVT